ncbi:MAG TPA: outer membrane lipoprotein-sorting protein [Polyangia bacterium]
MRSSLVAVVALVAAAAGVAHADPEASALLDRMDRATQGAANKVWICRMRSIGTDGNVREGRFLMLQNAADKRLLRFLSPADMRNTAMLALGKGELYVYLPADRRIRRLGTSALNQTFLGSDFYAEDLGSVRLHEDYDARVVSKSGNEVHLELLPKHASQWSRVLAVVIDHDLVSKFEFYDQKGKLSRTWTRTFERSKSRYEAWVPTRMLMVNESTKHATELIVEVGDSDKPISEDIFSLRALQRGDDLRYAP